LPFAGIRCAVEHLDLTAGGVHQLLASRPLGAQPATRERGMCIALDLDDLLVLHVYPLTAADRAVRADALHHAVSGRRARYLRARARGGYCRPAAKQVARAHLPDDRPLQGTPSRHKTTVTRRHP